jgi:hypothetical protein
MAAEGSAGDDAALRAVLAPSDKGQATVLRRIPLADVAAVAAISGRRPKEWRRSIEVSGTRRDSMIRVACGMRVWKACDLFNTHTADPDDADYALAHNPYCRY